MARISSYPQDTTVQDTDAWIGSDSVTRATKQYTAEAVAKYLNISAKISISGQMIFKFVDNATGVGDFSGPASGSAMTAITTMQLSTVDISTQNVVAFMTYLVGNNILISEQNDISVFGHYKINSYTASSAGFYTLNLTNIGGSGNLTGKLFYDFAVFTLPSDKPSPFQFNTTSTTGIESTGNTASGDYSTAMGESTVATGFSSTAMGYYTEASGKYSTAMGNGTTASGDGSTAMGFQTIASGYSSTAMGQFNVLNAADNATTFALTNTAFSIGNGTTAALRSDAFKVLFNGATTIGTSTPIAGSMFAVSRTSAPTSVSPTVGVFHDINYTGVSAGANLYGGVTRVKYFGSDAASFIVGKNNVVTIDPSSSGSVVEAIGTVSTATHSGSGDFSGGAGIIGHYSLGRCDSSSNFSVNQVIGNFQWARILNTGTQTVTGQVTGSISQVTFNNPNATSASVVGVNVQIEALKGDMGDTSLLYLNMKGSYANPDPSLSIDNFAYIKAIDNFAMPNVTGTSHFINSSVPLPSVFAGSVTSESLNVTALNTAPASATATGTLGSIKFTADHIYVCVATNTWKRVAIATF